jgi:hypothetical protein
MGTYSAVAESGISRVDWTSRADCMASSVVGCNSVEDTVARLEISTG